MSTVQKKIYIPPGDLGCHHRSVFTAYVIGGKDISVVCGVWALGRLNGQTGVWRPLSLDQCPPAGWEEFAEECAREALESLRAGKIPHTEVEQPPRRRVRQETK